MLRVKVVELVEQPPQGIEERGVCGRDTYRAILKPLVHLQHPVPLGRHAPIGNILQPRRHSADCGVLPKSLQEHLTHTHILHCHILPVLEPSLRSKDMVLGGHHRTLLQDTIHHHRPTRRQLRHKRQSKVRVAVSFGGFLKRGRVCASHRWQVVAYLLMWVFVVPQLPR